MSAKILLKKIMQLDILETNQNQVPTSKSKTQFLRIVGLLKIKFGDCQKELENSLRHLLVTWAQARQ